MALRVVGGSHERSGLDVKQAQRFSFTAQIRELLRADEAVDRQVLRARAQILTDGQHLDTATGDEIMHLFKSLHEGGQTIILVTHEDFIARIAQRQVHLRDGRIERDFMAAEVS